MVLKIKDIDFSLKIRAIRKDWPSRMRVLIERKKEEETFLVGLKIPQ